MRHEHPREPLLPRLAAEIAKPMKVRDIGTEALPSIQRRPDSSDFGEFWPGCATRPVWLVM
jgi:hypothetical protein